MSGFDWHHMIEQSYLDMYQEHQSKSSDHQELGYDYVFSFQTANICMLVEHQSLKSDSMQIKKATISKLATKAVNQVLRRHQQLQRKRSTPPFNHQLSDKPTFYIGLTSIAIVYNEQSYHMEHQLGSHFFQEECVLDLDDENRIMQVFSVQSFIQLMQMMQTPNDFLNFIKFHRQTLMSFHPFANEIELANHFMHSPIFFHRAWDIENQLVKIGLLDATNQKLEKAVHGDKESIQSLLEKSRSCSAMWMKLIRGLIKRQQREGNVDWLLIRKLVDQSMYTRMKLMEEVFSYPDQDRESRLTGYIHHQHSYSYFGQHYMIVVYGLDENSPLSKTVIHQQYADMLSDVNCQLQDPVMQDLFLLGLDMSHQDANGQIEVQMEVFYQKAVEMTESEKRLYRQLLALKAEKQMAR